MSVVVVMTAAVMGAVVIRSNLLNVMPGGNIFDVGSGGCVTIGFSGSSIAHHLQQ